MISPLDRAQRIHIQQRLSDHGGAGVPPESSTFILPYNQETQSV